jgi:hypothetical protein
MNVKELKEKLNEFPDDMEVIGLTGDAGFFISDVGIYKEDVYYAKYSTFWNRNAEHYSLHDGKSYYCDFIDGETVKLEIPKKKKEFLILQV